MWIENIINSIVEAPQYRNVLILFNGPSTRAVDVIAVNKLLKEGNTACIVTNSFFYGDIGLCDCEGLFYLNVDPAQVELIDVMRSGADPNKWLVHAVESGIVPEDQVSVMSDNFKAIENYSKFKKSRIISKSDLKKPSNYVDYRIRNNFVYKVIDRLCLRKHLNGWHKNRSYNFIRSKGSFYTKYRFLTYVLYLINYRSRHNSFLEAMDIARQFGAKKIYVSGRSCELSDSLVYKSDIPYYRYDYFYNADQKYIERRDLSPDNILIEMVESRKYIDSYEKSFGVKIKFASTDLWAIDRNVEDLYKWMHC